MKSLIHNSFTYNGTRLFNCIPQKLRNMKDVSTDTFKNHLDKWLADIPDRPPTPGYLNINTNRLHDWIMDSKVQLGPSGAPAQLCH
ncbi:hypothetical protein Pmani_001024 [Petrolisthes manimaculis]|uniref:Uncharacterized protein n=1 Tax=Petrolisthes manimaculis TaxID=1843537 RepID=A0AAE1ULR0_9EUCA|nr:hypothetical protein Pmani_001024 [Petrolisthes manimaculis]